MVPTGTGTGFTQIDNSSLFRIRIHPDPKLFGLKDLGMANLFLRLSSSFACGSVKLIGNRKKEATFALIV